MPLECEIDWRGHRFVLLPERALWWPEQRALVVADLHLGKPASFRSLGVPAPEAVTGADLARLTDAIRRTAAERLVVLGDLLHAASGMSDATIDAVNSWRALHRSLPVLVVRGNHDRRAGDPPAGWAFACEDGPLEMDGVDLAHEPDGPFERPALAGHIHPAVRAYATRGPGAVRAPCFWFGADVAVLPAFGGFTGCRVIRPARHDRVFAVGDGSVVEVRGAAAPA